MTSITAEKYVSVCFLTFYTLQPGPPNVAETGVTLHPYSPSRWAWVHQ